MQVMLMPGPLCSEVVHALRKLQRLSIVSGVIRGAPMSVSVVDTRHKFQHKLGATTDVGVETQLFRLVSHLSRYVDPPVMDSFR